MIYAIQYKGKSLKDLAGIGKTERRRVVDKIDDLADDLKGDVKRLTNYSPEYRLRVGDYRVLFNVVKDSVIVERVQHRSKAYRKN